MKKTKTITRKRKSKKNTKMKGGNTYQIYAPMSNAATHDRLDRLIAKTILKIIPWLK